MSQLTWTKEQQAIFDTVLVKREPFIKISAVAGASKTTVLVETARRFVEATPGGSFRYLVFGSQNSAEAKVKFKHTAICSTIHALAYDAIFRSGAYALDKAIQPFLTWKHVPKTVKIPFGRTGDALALVTEYCESGYVGFKEFSLAYIGPDPDLLKTAQVLLAHMFAGSMKCTHSFYLKLYHIGVMDGSIVPPHTDILAIDECGDLTQMTIDIFDQYPATQKIMVGDDGQAIFSFMGCLNGFDHFAKRGVSLQLSQSFRVCTPLAEGIQDFCNSTFAPDMVFKGMDYPEDTVPTTEAYITRTNSALVAKMVELNITKTPYKLVSKAKVDQLFKYPKFLMYIKAGNKQYDPELKSLQQDVDHYHLNKTLHVTYKSDFLYVLASNEDNPGLAAAANLLRAHSYNEIQEAYDTAEAHKKASCNLTLMTAHSSKGLERDIITLDDDMDKSIDKIMLKYKHDKRFVPTVEELAESKLYYVACSRAKLHINNAKHLLDLR